jgi:PAS domain S-box-containing protein
MEEGVNILIVEDEAIIAMDIARTLENMGYRVVDTLSRGEDCLDRCRSNDVDVVLMDIKLQGEMDGIEAARTLSLERTLPVIFLTAYSNRNIVSRVRDVHPYGYLIKPVNERDLRIAIETAVSRHASDRIIQQKEQRYRALFEESTEPICVLDDNNIIREANRRMADLFGYEQGEMVQLPFHELLAPDSAFSLESNNRYGGEFDLKMVTRKGETLFCVARTSHGAESGSGSDLQVIVEEVGEKRRTLREAVESREKLRSLSSHLTGLIENEKRNLARELHDVLGQDLTGLKFDLDWLRRRMEGNEPELTSKIESMTRLVEGLMQRVRRVSIELRPGLLDDLGLSAAIEWQAEEFTRRTGIPCNLLIEPEDISLEEGTAIALYRIFQELLTNVIRHAGATTLDVSLCANDGDLEFNMTDNGRGITPEEMHREDSFGLLGIRERVYMLNGELSIEGRPGQGTRVHIEIPGVAL